MPGIVYGTAWKKERTAGLVERALHLGFRGIDTACQPKHYAEAGVGRGIAAWLAAGHDRAQLYLQTKFTPLKGHDPERVPYTVDAGLSDQVKQSCHVSLDNLGVFYLDALLLHSPLVPFARTLEVWREFEALVGSGLVGELGISNCYDIVVLKALWQAAHIKPQIVQNRFYRDTGYDKQIRAFCYDKGLIYQTFWTLSANPHVLSHATFARLARRYGVTPAALMFRSVSQLGMVPLTGTSSEAHMKQALGAFDFELTGEELGQIEALFVPA